MSYAWIALMRGPVSTRLVIAFRRRMSELGFWRQDLRDWLREGGDWPGAVRKKMAPCPGCNELVYVDGPQRFHCDQEYAAYLKHKEQQHR